MKTTLKETLGDLALSAGLFLVASGILVGSTVLIGLLAGPGAAVVAFGFYALVAVTSATGL